MATIQLISLPVEVIELIAFYVAIQSPFRPPSELLKFCLINKQTYELLSPSNNTQLYANIFRSLFDTAALQRRFRSSPFSHTPHNLQSHSRSHPAHSCSPTPTTSTLAPEHPHNQPPSNPASQSSHHLTPHSLPSHPIQTCSSAPSSNPNNHSSQAPSTQGSPKPDETEEPCDNLNDYSNQALSTQSSPKPDETEEPCQDSGELCNSLLADAYFERLALFKRMQTFAGHSPPVHPTPQRSTDLAPYHPAHHPDDQPSKSISRDLWLIYLMVLENDDTNWLQLRQAANVTGFLLNYFHYEIYPSATAPGYPTERPEIAIALRLCHLFLDLEDSDPEVNNYWISETGIETYLFALKPYTFASQRYDVAYAPCSIRELPINTSSEKDLQALSHKLTAREKATLMIPMNSDYSEDDPPNRGDHLVDLPPRTTTVHSSSDEQSSHADDSPGFTSTPKYSEIIYMGKLIKILPPLHSHVALQSFFWCNSRHSRTPTSRLEGIDDQIGYFLRMMEDIRTLRSTDYDREFVRMTSCVDPLESAGLRFDQFRNCFHGGWDGQFGFLDLTSFRSMLLGSLESVYEGRYGDQNQVFKCREFMVRVSDGMPVKFIEDLGDTLGDRYEHSSHRREGGNEPRENEMEHLLKMKSLVRPEPREPVMVKYNPSERYEIQIHGTGHSSWGKFQVKGRVRAWDGMLTFLKIYDAGRHGKWFYRGYYTAGDMIVGRWRDTLTAQGLDGYEGMFVLFKRN